MEVSEQLSYKVSDSIWLLSFLPIFEDVGEYMRHIFYIDLSGFHSKFYRQ